MSEAAKLTAGGITWAMSHPHTMVARVALAGDGWPEEYRVTAIEVCNKAADVDQQRRAGK